MDPLAGTPWSVPSTVEGFARGTPNPVLMAFAERLRSQPQRNLLLDIGCGAGRNAVPLARAGWRVAATDLSVPMLQAARRRAEVEGVSGSMQLCLARMDALPIASGTMDVVVAHGIWNLARSGREMRDAIREAARCARDGAALFVFTFSRHTLPDSAEPVAGETFVYTQFSGEPQCFLTEDQLFAELSDAGFVPDPALPLIEHNRPQAGTVRTMSGPVIYECGFRRQQAAP